MFSSTAYEAYYTYIGLYLHQRSVEIITSHKTMVMLLVLILGISFILGAWRYFSKFLPQSWGRGRTTGIGFIFRIIACFLIGVSLLQVGSNSTVKDYKRASWHNNSYLTSRFSNIQDQYEVSFVFDLLTRTAEELAGYAASVVDEMFGVSNSELKAPAAFYKATMYAASLTIDDAELRDLVDVYTDSCFDKVIPFMGGGTTADKVNELFEKNGMVDNELKHVPLTLADGQRSNCLLLKNKVRERLHRFAGAKGALYKRYSQRHGTIIGEITDSKARNVIASNTLLNHYRAQTEDGLGIQKGSEVRGNLAKFFQATSRVFSFDGILNMFGQHDQVGAALTAGRAEKFSEYLQRAPHIKGMVKMFLILIFPWLIFFVVAGRWKIIISWFALYCSVLLWTPLWTLLYHLMTSIAMSNEMMMEWGRLGDGISLYSAELISAKLYPFYAIYSWLQILIGPLPTMILAYGMFSSFLADSQSEQAPQVVTNVKDVGVSAATGGASAAAQTVIRKV